MSILSCMVRKTFSGFLVFLAAATAHAAQRSSASYSVITDTVDLGGDRSTSAIYTNDGNAGGAGGLSTATAANEFSKDGYAGQLYDVTSLAVTAATDPATVAGGATLPLGAWQVLDDGSFLAVDASSVAWSVVNGPVAGISSTGLASAGPVSQNTGATIQATYAGNTGLLGLTVNPPAADFTSATQVPIISDGYSASGSSIALALGFAPTSGAVLTVVQNTGSTAIQGTFSNLVQGQTVYLSYGGQNYAFIANYNGGSNGRSLVLQLIAGVAAMPVWASLTAVLLLAALGVRGLAPQRPEPRGGQ
jgi:hypothetical protein